MKQTAIIASGNMEENSSRVADWAKLVGAIASGMGIMFGFLRWWIPRRAVGRKVESGIEEMKIGYDIMEEVVHHRKICDRAIIFKAHNDGGYPTLASPYYVTANHWVCRKADNYKQIERYKNLEVDAPYCKMIWKLIKEKSVVLSYETMEPGILKDLYQAENVCEGLIVVIGSKGKNLHYMSFAKYTENGGFREKEITQLKLAAHEIAEKIL